MLRNFYILMYISACFCHKYIEENHPNKLRTQNENRKSVTKSKMVQFDVASFIKNAATVSSQDYEPFSYRNSKPDNRRTQSNDYYEPSINENKGDINSDYFNIEKDSQDVNDSDQSLLKDEDGNIDTSTPYEDVVNTKKSILNEMENDQNELLIDNDLIQNPEKKCVFKDMKVPFFSRKPTAAKKQKKRKLLCFNCSKVYTNASKSDASSKVKLLNGKIKRAYENLCPKCMRKLFKIHHKKRSEIATKNRETHNSREFYQNIGITTTPANDPSAKRANENAKFDYYFSNNNRVKREENEERERQLKELAEVEKKVEHVKIITPFTKMIKF